MLQKSGAPAAKPHFTGLFEPFTVKGAHLESKAALQMDFAAAKRAMRLSMALMRF